MVWKPVKVHTDSVTIQGGYNTQREFVPSITYEINGTTHNFVEISKCAPWFNKAVAGPKCRRGVKLKSVSVLAMLRAKFHGDTCNPSAAEPAVAATVCVPAPCTPVVAATHADDYDPMNEMDVIGPPPVSTKKKPAQTPRKKTDPERAEIRHITVQCKPPCAQDATDETTTVCLYRRPTQDKKTQGSLFIRTDAIPWLLSYAATEYDHQGVVPFDPAPQPELSANCSAVAGLFLEFDFGRKMWLGEFVAGPCKGTEVRMAISQLNKRAWHMLLDAKKVTGYLSQASARKKGRAVK